MARRVDSEALRSELLVNADERDLRAEWPNARILRVFLQILPDLLGQDLDGNLVLEFVLELRRCLPKIHNHVSGVVHVANHDAADVVGDAVNAGDGVWHDQFVRYFLLRADDDAVFALDRDRRLAEGLNSLERVLHLVDPPVSREDLHHLFHLYNIKTTKTGFWGFGEIGRAHV